MVNRRDLEPSLSEPGDTAGPARRRIRALRSRGRWLCVFAAAITVAALATTPAAATLSGSAALSRGHSMAGSDGDAGASARVPPYVPGYGAYLGIDPDFIPKMSHVTMAEDVSADVHRSFGIIAFYTSWSSAPMTLQAAAARAEGAIPLVSMHCTGLDTSVTDGAEDAQIKAQAEAYAAYGGPVLFRWFWEMNLPNTNNVPCLGTGTVATQAAAYRAAYVHIWTIFQQAGATNVAFVWAPSAPPTLPSAIAFYPGSEYVNWIGGDMYDRTSKTFAEEYSPFYATYRSYGKPMILSETGAVGASGQAAWLGNIAGSLPTQFPEVHAIVYVDANDDPGGDFMLVPGGAGMGEFAAVGEDPYFDQPQGGFAIATARGFVRSYSDGPNYSVGGQLNKPIVGMADTTGGKGYWLAASDGGIFTFGNAKFYGSTGGMHLNKPIVDIRATPDGGGYWLVASDGGLFTFGDAKFHGSTGGMHLNKPIVGMAVAPGGRGYWFVASDGGIFTFGDAKFHGSAGGIHLNSAIVGMAATPDGGGYWLVAADGGIFCFGDAHYLGSLGATKLASPVAGMSAAATGGNYRLVTAAGSVYELPGNEWLSSPSAAPVVAIVSTS